MPAGAGSAAPESDNARWQAGVIEWQGIEQSSQHTDPGVADQARKADATLIARAALASVELVRLADGTWIARRWGMVKPLTDAEVEPWLRRIGAPAA